MNGPYRLAGPATLDCDVLVIGSGAGGSVVASELTAVGKDVLMVEEGPFVRSDDMPGNLSESFARTWRGGGLTVAVGRPPVAYAEGCCVGGGPEINSAIIQRTPDELLDQWGKTFDIADFNAASLAPYYDRVEKILGVTAAEGRSPPSSEILRIGAERMGRAVSRLPRAQRGCVGDNKCILGCPSGAKQTMTHTLLPAALSHGLRLVSECRVVSLTVVGQRVTGARALARDHIGRSHDVKIRCRDVFLCAGTVHTPALLRRSGIRRRVGNSLRLHPMVKAVAEFDELIDAQATELPLYAVTEWMPERRLGGSIFTPALMAAGLADDWPKGEELMQRYRNCGLYYAQARGRGIGRVRPARGRAVEPLVTYTLDSEDRRHLACGLADLVELLFAAGARRVVPLIGSHPGFTSPLEASNLRDAGLPWERTTISTIHLTSSCPPGATDAAATDSYGRLREFENVVVADASQIPDAPGTNPQGTVMVMALRAAEAFLSARRQSGGWNGRY